MQYDDDAPDVALALEGDSSAFGRIVRRWEGRLVSLAHRLTRDRTLAEDLAQMAFLQAYRSLSRWRREGSFGAWLTRVALNVYRGELRRLRLDAVALDQAPEPEAENAAPADEGPLDQPLRRALAGLPLIYREAITLYYFEEMDVARAATALSVSQGTLKARLSRGRALLRKTLESEEDAS